MDERMYISLSDIECEEIVQKIKLATEIVIKFWQCTNKYLKKVKLEEPKIIIVCENKQVYEDDGYTATPGYAYKVYWFLPYITLGDNYFNIVNFESYMWPLYIMFFELDMEERISDRSFDGHSFFKLYITDDSNNADSRIASYNNNYQLTSMLDSENIFHAIKKINASYNKYMKKKKIFNQIKEIKIDESSIESFIVDRIIKY